MRFFLVDRKNHDEICKKYGLDFEGSYLVFPELWGFHDFWIYEESAFLKRLEQIREETAPIQYFSTTGSFERKWFEMCGGYLEYDDSKPDSDPDPWETLDRLMESFANDYLKERVYDLDGVRIEYKSEPLRFRQAEFLELHGITQREEDDERFKRTYRTHTGQRRGKNDFLDRWREGREA